MSAPATDEERERGQGVNRDEDEKRRDASEREGGEVKGSRPQ